MSRIDHLDFQYSKSDPRLSGRAELRLPESLEYWDLLSKVPGEVVVDLAEKLSLRLVLLPCGTFVCELRVAENDRRS